MDILLSSRQSIAKPFQSLPIPKERRRSPVIVSFRSRAAKASCQKDIATFYEVLSLNPNKASINEIKKAYRTMALRHHPDVSPPHMKEESTRFFVQLNAAYRTLSDPALRREYEFDLGFENSERISKKKSNDQFMRSSWQEQILELKRRSDCPPSEKKDSWGSRIRAQNSWQKV